MAYTERTFRILWGPTLENALDFVWPVVGSSALFWREPRPGSSKFASQGIDVAWITGRYFKAKITAQYFGFAQNFGALGLQAFLDWAMDSNAFTLVPNLALPTLTVPGCYLEGPFTTFNPSLESDVSQTLDLTFFHPTQDLGLAWRGLFYEYAAGGSLIDPLAYTFSRANIGYEIGPDGYLHIPASGIICDGNYPSPLGTGLQTTILGPAVTNDITNPEALDNASWNKTDCSITANTAKAPDGNLTADLVVEDAVASVFHTCNSNTVTITAGDPQTALCFVRSGGRFKGLFMINDGATGAGGNKAGITYDLHAGTIATLTNGTGTVTDSGIIPLANQWFMLWFRGALNGAVTSSTLTLRLADASGNLTYTGDGVSGTYFWGATSVHGIHSNVADYTPTTSAADNLKAIGALAAIPPQAMFIYVSLVECGAHLAPSNDFPSPIALGNFASPNWRTILYFANGSGYNFSNGNSVSQVIANTGNAAVSFGQSAEYLGLVFSDGSVNLLWALAGGAENAAGRTTPPTIAPPASYGVNDILFANAGGGYGTDTHQIARVKIGPLITTASPWAIQHIAAARAV